MKTKIITVNVARYYSKMASIDVEVPIDLVGDKLIDFLTNDDDLNDDYENAVYDDQLDEDDTTYEYYDYNEQIGGHL